MALSLGSKITICFLPVVIIPAAMSVFSANAVNHGKDNVSILSNDYISEVEVGAELRGAVNRPCTKCVALASLAKTPISMPHKKN